MRLKKLCVCLSMVLLVAFGAVALTACNKNEGNTYFDAETVFHWDVAGGTNLGTLDFVTAGTYTFKTDGTLKWEHELVNDMYAQHIPEFDGTYKLSSTKDKITITRAGTDYGPYDLTDGAKGGLRFEYEFTDFFPAVGLGNSIYYSDVANLTPIPQFAYPANLLGTAIHFDEVTAFSLDTATVCGTLAGATGSVITFNDNGAFTMSTTMTDSKKNTATAGAYNLIKTNSDVTGIKLLFAAQVIAKVPFFDGLTETNVISLEMKEKTENDLNYMVLYYKKSTDAKLISTFYSNANMIPETNPIPAILTGLPGYKANDRQITFEAEYQLAQFIAYANGRYEYIPSDTAISYGQKYSEGFYATTMNVISDANINFALHLLEDGKTESVDIVKYDLQIVNDGFTFIKPVNESINLTLTELQDPSSYPTDKLGELNAFDSNIGFTYTNPEDKSQMTLTFTTKGTYEMSAGPLLISTGFYNLNADKTKLTILTSKGEKQENIAITTANGLKSLTLFNFLFVENAA